LQKSTFGTERLVVILCCHSLKILMRQMIFKLDFNVDDMSL
jgi:hypothetical protein